MYFVAGLLCAGLLVLIVSPALWRRAVRLTRHRVESMVPVSLAEIRADKDHLRAEFAVATRALELKVGHLEDRAAEQEVEIGRKREEAARLAREHAERTAELRDLEARASRLSDELAARVERLAAVTAELAARDRLLEDRARAFSVLKGDYEAAQQLIEEQQVEMVARNTEIASLGTALAAQRGSEARLAAASEEMNRAFEAAKASLAAEILRRDQLAADVTRLAAERDRQGGELALRQAEIERLNAELAGGGARRQELEERLAAAEKALSEARAEIAELRRRAEAGSDNLEKAIAATEAEKAALGARFARLEGDILVLRDENSELKRVAGASWDAEKAENAALRQRLSAIANDIVALSQKLAAAEAAQAASNDDEARPRRPYVPPPPATRRPGPAHAGEQPGAAEARTLAERIRALQHSVSRH